MSWFNRLVSGVGAGVNWLSQNSGTIGKAALAVARVAGVVPKPASGYDDLEFDEAAVQNYVADLQPHFNAANRKLLRVAKEAHKPSAFEQLAENETQESEISGIWSSPAIGSDEPPVGLYQDLNKFLHQENIPTLIGDPVSMHTLGYGFFADVALHIGKQIFGGLFGKSDVEVTTSDDGVRAVPFKAEYMDDGVTISGVHAYYPLPMGQAADQHAWHGALYVKTTTTPEFRSKQAEMRYKMLEHTLSPSVLVASADPSQKFNFWNVTLRVSWTSCDTADSALPLVASYMKKNFADHKIAFNQRQGVFQVLKIEADGVKYTPASIRMSVTQAVANALNTIMNPRSVKLDPLRPVKIIASGLQMPDIQITGSSIQVSNGPS